MRKIDMQGVGGWLRGELLSLGPLRLALLAKSGARDRADRRGFRGREKLPGFPTHAFRCRHHNCSYFESQPSNFYRNILSSAIRESTRKAIIPTREPKPRHRTSAAEGISFPSWPRARLAEQLRWKLPLGLPSRNDPQKD
jgi:hypothetical protein